MTTELEQKFFKVFGIEPFCDLPCNKRGVECTDNTYCGNKYPEITDRKLLEIICILSQSYPLNYEGWSFFTIQDLKEEILESCIKTAKKLSLSSVFASNIQQLFKEGE